MDDALRITQTGLTLTSTTVVISGVAIPTNSNGDPARYLRVMAESGFGYIKLGTSIQSSSLVATLSDILVTANESLLLHTRGLTHISAITRSGTTLLSCVPIEE